MTKVRTVDGRHSFNAIVFDFDGVLVESVDVKTQAFAELYRTHGETVVEQVVAHHLANGGVSRFEKFRYFHSNILGVPLRAEEEVKLGERFSSLVEDAVVAAPYVAGAREFLENNSIRLPMYVASGTPQQELQRIIARRGMAQYFREIYGSPAVKGLILQKIVQDNGCDPNCILMVGDAMTDYEGALQAGTSFIGRVPPGVKNPFPASVRIFPNLEGLQRLCG